MNRAILQKAIREASLLFLACAVLLFSFAWVRIIIISVIEMSTFTAVFEKLWGQFQDFFPVPLSQVLSYSGRIAITFDEPVVVFTMTIFAIARGSDVVSGEINRGTMEMLLAQPVSRLQVLWCQTFVTVIGILLLASCTWAGTWCGVMTTSVKEAVPTTLRMNVGPVPLEVPIPYAKPTFRKIPMKQLVETRVFVPGAMNLAALGICLAGVSALLSSFDRYRWRTIGFAVTFYVVGLICKIVGLALPDWRWLKFLSIFTAYEPQKFVYVAVSAPESVWHLGMYGSDGSFAELAPLGYCSILIGIGLVCYLAASVVFHRRDVPAPL